MEYFPLKRNKNKYKIKNRKHQDTKMDRNVPPNQIKENKPTRST